MPGYWPSSSFLGVFMDRDGVEVHKLAEKERSSHLNRTNFGNKKLIIWLSGNFSCGTRLVVSSGQYSSILPARVANHSIGFDSSCPLTELSR